MNTPTEFDKELEDILQKHRNTYGKQTLMTPDEILEATIGSVKQAVDKYVISVSKPIYVKNDLPSLLATDDYIKVRDELRDEQRQSLWGDKK